jgi:hypothetical protein
MSENEEQACIPPHATYCCLLLLLLATAHYLAQSVSNHYQPIGCAC